MKNKIANRMHSSLVIVIALIAGVVTGIYLPKIVPPLKAFGAIYVTLLEMCVYPHYYEFRIS